MKRTIATSFEVLRFHRILLLVIIKVPFWSLSSLPQSQRECRGRKRRRGCFRLEFLSCCRRFLDVDVEVADHDVAVVVVLVVGDELTSTHG